MPSSKSAFRLVIAVVDATVSGAVPAATVETNCVPDKLPAESRLPFPATLNFSTKPVVRPLKIFPPPSASKIA
ncbi:MAG: hypothetical protein LAO07_16505, partial [Acidobacteriia bacterium]|nr:hypothetical protein [Terriglobia bacterium]